MTAQFWATMALVVAAIIQGAGIWARRKVAQEDLEIKRKQFRLDSEKFAYRKLLDVKLGNVTQADVGNIEEKFPTL